MGDYGINDWKNLPEGTGVQIIEGYMVQEPSPTYGHQNILLHLSFLIQSYLLKYPIGELCISPLDVILENQEIYQPDLIFILNENKSIIKDHITGAPDLVIEIISPGSIKYDRGHKKDVYQKNGVKEYWLIDQLNQTIEIYTLANGAYTLSIIENSAGTITSQILKGFTIKVSDLFRQK